MKKTNKILSVFLAVVMLFSAMSVSLLASAEEPAEEKTLFNATFVLDKLDEVLAKENIYTELDLSITKITIDLRSVDGLLSTLDLIKGVSGLVKGALNQDSSLQKLVTSKWTTDQSRAKTGDEKVIANLISFILDNRPMINDVIRNDFSCGYIGKKVFGKDVVLVDVDKLVKEKTDGKVDTKNLIPSLLGADLCTYLKQTVAGLIYEKDSAEYKACVEKALDKIIFEDLATVGVDKLLQMADDAIIKNYVDSEEPLEPVVYLYKELNFRFVGSLNGFKYDSSKTLDGLIADIANTLYANLRTPLNKMVAQYGEELDSLLADSGKYGEPFADLYHFSKLNFKTFTAKSIVDINKFFGMLVRQICDFKWNDSANLGVNIQNMFMWAIQNRDKTVENDPYTGVKGKTFADYAMSLAKMIVANNVTGDDRETVIAKMDSCKNATEVLTILLPYLLNRDASVVSEGSTTYGQVLGDIVGHYADGYIPVKFVPGTDIWVVANDIANYYLVKWNVDAVFGLNLTTTETFFSKLDKIQAVLMNGIDYVKASTYIPALLKNILALDLSAFVKEGFEDAFANKNKTVASATLICRIVDNVYKAVLNESIFTFKTVAATTSKNGSIQIVCNLDGKTVATVKTDAKVSTTVTLSKTSYTYSGKANKPTPTVKDVNGKTLKKDTDYTVSYKDNTNAGTATAVVTLKGKYSGTVKATFKINALDASKLKVTVDKKSMTYTGKALKPTVTIKNADGKKLLSGTDYSITYKNNTKVGQASLTVKYKGNYKGTSKTYTFTIVPKETTMSKVTAASKGFTATWKKQATQTTGYEVQYSTSSKFTSSTTKTVTVKKNSTVSQKVTKLKASTKYYVRVRTYTTAKVDGKSTKLYSAWSKSMTVTTKK